MLTNLDFFSLKLLQNDFYWNPEGGNENNNCKIRSVSVFCEQIRALDVTIETFNEEFVTPVVIDSLSADFLST